MSIDKFIATNLSDKVVLGSKYFTKPILNTNNKLFLYFENYFKTSKINMELSNLKFEYRNGKNVLIFSDDVYDRFDVLSAYIEDDGNGDSFVYAPNPSYVNIPKLTTCKTINKPLFRFLVSFKLTFVYLARYFYSTTNEISDKLIEDTFYELADIYNVGYMLDQIIYLGREANSTLLDNESLMIHELKNDEEIIKRFNSRLQSKKAKPDYEYNKKKESKIIRKCLEAHISQYTIPFVAIAGGMAWDNEEVHSFKDSMEYGIRNSIRDIKVKLLYDRTIDDDKKKKIIDKIDEFIESEIFEDIREYDLIDQALAYADNNRPLLENQKLLDAYKDKKKYKFTGVVYHGFRNGGYNADVNILRQYEKDGFISCSKDINVAANFAGTFPYGGILKIEIGEDIEAIDIEKILKDAYDKSNNKYKSLYKSFIKEKEVLIKMPIKYYTVLSPREIAILKGKVKHDNPNTKKFVPLEEPKKKN